MQICFSNRLFLFYTLISFLFISKFTDCYSQSIQLTKNAQISVVVADPGTEELFEAFGHPAIRVYDPENQIDLAFNYGIFDFDQPYFYLNFTRGYLNYMVAAWPYPAFENIYISENRSLKEYVLDLSEEQKQTIFNFLAENVKPENRNYFYDYFYDNCSTRIWDVLEKCLGEDLIFDENYTATGHSFRTLVDSLTTHKLWGDFGIDLCLGLPMDKELTSYEYMFLPEFLGRSLAHASVITKNGEVPLVNEEKVIFESQYRNIPNSRITPLLIFWLIFSVIVIITIIEHLTQIRFTGFDLLLFGTAGLIGLLLVVLWFGTDHQAAADNLNIIWANPLYLIGLIFFLKKKGKNIGRKVFMIFAVILLLFLVTWPFNPQGINIAVIPISLTLLLRATYIKFFQ